MASLYDSTEGGQPVAASLTALRIAEKKFQLHLEQRLRKTKNGRMRGGKLVAQPTDLSDVVDIRCPGPTGAVLHTFDCTPPAVISQLVAANTSSVQCDGTTFEQSCSVSVLNSSLHLQQSWQQHTAQLEAGGRAQVTALRFPQHPGLVVFPAALPPQLQLQLMHAAVKEWPEPPTRTNHTAVYGLMLKGLFSAAQAGLALREQVSSQQQEQQRQSQGQPARQDPPSRDDTTGCTAEAKSNSNCTCQDNYRAHPAHFCSDAGTLDPAVTVQPIAAVAAADSNDLSCIWSDRGKGAKAAVLLRKLRWASLGPPFNWTARVYEQHAPHRPLPYELVDIATHFAELAVKCSSCPCSVPAEEPGVAAEAGKAADSDTTGCMELSAAEHRTATTAASGSCFKPDVALVNYYQAGDTLSCHKDDVEKDMSLPIVTMSLGCDAVFLMGGQSRDQVPTALLLRSGDVVVLGGAARSCYHGVPRILPEHGLQPDVLAAAGQLGSDFEAVLRHMQQCRVNVSIRSTQ